MGLLLVITLLLLLLLLVVLTGLRRHLTVGCGSHEGGHDVYGNWEHDGAVVLSRDAVQSLQVAELQSCRTVHDDLCRLSQGSAGLVFSLGSDHFSSGLSSSLSLSSHGSLELLGDPDVLHLHPLHSDAPGLGALIKDILHLPRNGFSLAE